MQDGAQKRHSRAICVIRGACGELVADLMTIHTVEEKRAEVDERAAAQRKLGADIDKVLAKQKQEEEFERTGCGGAGCFPSIGRALMRGLGVKHAVYLHASTGENKTDARMKAAADGLKRRVSSLEARIQDCRTAASVAMKAGNRATAMRQLIKSKALEKQLASTQSVLDSLEAQTDLMEQASLQKTVAAALGMSAKSLKKERKVLADAENAVDKAGEMRDLGQDLNDVLAGFDVPNDVDEDELLAELEGMVDNTPPPDEAAQMMAAEAALIEKHARYDEAALVNAKMASVPIAPARGRNKSDRVRLLSAESV